MAITYKSKPGDSKCNEAADPDKNGTVDILDRSGNRLWRNNLVVNRSIN